MPNLQQQPVIAIDGTSASGKSTLSEKLAELLGAERLEYSLVFRAIAHHMHEVQGFEPEFGNKPATEQIDAAVAYARTIGAMVWDDFSASVKHNPALRSVMTSRTAPFFSGLPEILDITDEVFIALVNQCPCTVIAEGRTIGRYVYPNADVKFFVDATLYRRAQRRYANVSAKGKEESLESVLTDLAHRDHQDQTRDTQPTGFDPHCQYWLDTTSQSIEQTLQEAQAHIRQKL